MLNMYFQTFRSQTVIFDLSQLDNSKRRKNPRILEPKERKTSLKMLKKILCKVDTYLKN